MPFKEKEKYELYLLIESVPVSYNKAFLSKQDFPLSEYFDVEQIVFKFSGYSKKHFEIGLFVAFDILFDGGSLFNAIIPGTPPMFYITDALEAFNLKSKIMITKKILINYINKTGNILTGHIYLSGTIYEVF